MSSDDNPMHHPEEQPPGGDGLPHFGRLLIILFVVVALITLLAINA